MNGRVAKKVIVANFCHFGPPPMGLLFKLQQHITLQRTTFLMKTHDIKNENLVLSGKILK